MKKRNLRFLSLRSIAARRLAKFGMTSGRRYTECFDRLSTALVSASLLFFVLMLAGCKSAPAGRTVDPLELLDSESSFYLAVPKEADNVLIERIITGLYENASETDAKMIADRVNKVYCGLSRSKNNMEVQAVVDGNIPRNALQKVLNAKRGWNGRDYNPEGSSFSYKIYSNSDILTMSFPSDRIGCLGRGVEGMLDKYDSLSKLPPDGSDKLYTDLDSELTEYLKGAETEIRFFASKPQSFLTILTGAQLDLKLFDVKGNFTTDPKHPNQYLLDLDFRFKNGTFLKAGKTLLTLAFGLTNSQEEIIGDSELIINDIRIDKQQLYKLLSL